MSVRATSVRAPARGPARPPQSQRRGLPRLPTGYTEPRRLADVAREPMPPLIVIQAPRGFGKTAATSWLLRSDTSDRHDYAWVNLPHRDVEPDELWESVRRRVRDLGLEEVDDGWEQVDEELGRRRRHLVIAIDDLQRVSDPVVDEELFDLAARHENIHLIVMARHERRLQSLAPQVDGLVITADDLRLGATETVRMAGALGHRLTTEEAGWVADQLLGWPALLRTVMAEPIRSRTGLVRPDQGAVERFARVEADDLQPGPGRSALLALSVPGELTVELAHRIVTPAQADAGALALRNYGVDAPADGSALLPLPEPLRRANAKIFADEDPAGFREISAEVARWSIAHDDPAAALGHAIDARDFDLVSEVLEASWARLIVENQDLTRRALDLLPDRMAAGSAHLRVARDYILNVATEERARAAYGAGLLIPGATRRARAGQRLSLRQVLSLHSSGLYDTARGLVEHRHLGDAISESGWGEDVVGEIPELLQEWATSKLLGAPGVGATFAFAEAYAWAEQLGDASRMRDAAAGAALSHVVVGNPDAARVWLHHLDGITPGEATPLELAAVAATESLIALHSLRDLEFVQIDLPPELSDLDIVCLKVRTQLSLQERRPAEAVRLLEAYRVRPAGEGASLAEHGMVDSLVEAYLASNQLDKARRLLLEVDPGGLVHRVARAQVDFHSGEFERVVAASEPSEVLMPRQTLHLSLMRACAALRLEQRGMALDAFQTAVSTAAQTGMVRPFALVPRADLAVLAEGNEQLAELIEHIPDSQRGLLGEPEGSVGLSPRELQVLEVVATGAPLTAVASRLYVSPNTVKSQMRDIYRKLGVRGRDKAVERARELGLLRG